MSKTVNYDFSITNFVTVKAPYGTNPDTLVDQALEQLLALLPLGWGVGGNSSEIEFRCENTLDDDGNYEPIPEEWYDKD